MGRNRRRKVRVERPDGLVIEIRGPSEGLQQALSKIAPALTKAPAGTTLTSDGALRLPIKESNDAASFLSAVRALLELCGVTSR